MGLLIDGVWNDRWYDTSKTGGRFERSVTQWRNCIPDGTATPGRFHLYVSYACPWAHRTLIVHCLKGLESVVPIHVVHPLMRENGWTFDSNFPDCTGDPLYGLHYLHQLYTKAKPNVTSRVTVPVLWDAQDQTIVNNESSEIIRMFNTCFDHLGAKPGDYYPESLRPAIDAVNEWIYPDLNNGVYQAGFATTQSAYDEAVARVFNALGRVEQILARQRYLVDPHRLTEADIRLFTTLLRFDPVYHTHFKCDLNRIRDYPNVHGFLRDLFQTTGIASTCKPLHYRTHYFCSHTTINPTQIISIGPDDNLQEPHGRDCRELTKNS
eukprot:Protomagalhaensia_wolfi_Nauph_80__2922@NODE_2_length_7647_cov_170_632755_g1_i0_p2_GENE_NODE_2_length_7647_cov_170_632755_g1_i0NODE_2_length_7647_cov_170_632755_g1_i0_p2_ORF_typecomplete_len323_score15_05GST_N_2/PF13409_6/1_3e24GST_C_2/PF13410_6/2_9e14GST_C/PF00043_25/8_2e10GST_N_3/PF13417_6/0_039GST_C_5/PF16865_5/0_043_NODE_2_length_7647_cov_170_632755_g1_i0351003